MKCHNRICSLYDSKEDNNCRGVNQVNNCDEFVDIEHPDLAQFLLYKKALTLAVVALRDPEACPDYVYGKEFKPPCPKCEQCWQEWFIHKARGSE